MSSSGSGWPLGGVEGDEPGTASYEWSEPSGRPGGPYGEGLGDEYGRDAGRSGRHSALSPYGGAQYGQEAYGQEAYGQEAYGHEAYGHEAYGPDAYGGDYRQGWSQSREYPEDQSGHGHYDTGPGQGWYGQEAAGGSFGDPRYGADTTDRDP